MFQTEDESGYQQGRVCLLGSPAHHLSCRTLAEVPGRLDPVSRAACFWEQGCASTWQETPLLPLHRARGLGRRAEGPLLCQRLPSSRCFQGRRGSPRAGSAFLPGLSFLGRLTRSHRAHIHAGVARTRSGMRISSADEKTCPWPWACLLTFIPTPHSYSV